MQSFSVIDCYRPQRSWAKVMFLQASVILLTGGVCLSACWDTHLPRADTPLRADTPKADTPPRADTPRKQTHPLGADTPPRADTPLPKQTPAYSQRAAGTHPTGMHSCYRIAYEVCMNFKQSIPANSFSNVLEKLKPIDRLWNPNLDKTLGNVSFLQICQFWFICNRSLI